MRLPSCQAIPSLLLVHIPLSNLCEELTKHLHVSLVDLGDNGSLAGLIEGSLPTLATGKQAVEFLPLLATGGLDVADGKDAVIRLGEVELEVFVVAKARDEVAKQVELGWEALEVPGEGADDDGVGDDWVDGDGLH